MLQEVLAIMVMAVLVFGAPVGCLIKHMRAEQSKRGVAGHRHHCRTA